MYIYISIVYIHGFSSRWNMSRWVKFLSCSHCQDLCQQASWLLICCTRVNNQSEVRTASWHNSDMKLKLKNFHPRWVKYLVIYAHAHSATIMFFQLVTFSLVGSNSSRWRMSIDSNWLKRKLMSLSHGQAKDQLADLASDWLFTLVQPIRSRLACWPNSWQWLKLINFHPWSPLHQLTGNVQHRL